MTLDIEDSADWKMHAKFRAEADAAGLCFKCSSEFAFRKMEELKYQPGLFRNATACEKCKGNVPR